MSNYNHGGNGRTPRGPGRAPLRAGGFLMPHIPCVELADLFERINPKGQRYLVGRVGKAKLLVIPTGQLSRGEQVWHSIIAQGPYTSEEAEALAREYLEGGSV